MAFRRICKIAQPQHLTISLKEIAERIKNLERL